MLPGYFQCNLSFLQLTPLLCTPTYHCLIHCEPSVQPMTEIVTLHMADIHTHMCLKRGALPDWRCKWITAWKTHVRVMQLTHAGSRTLPGPVHMRRDVLACELALVTCHFIATTLPGRHAAGVTLQPFHETTIHTLVQPVEMCNKIWLTGVRLQWRVATGDHGVCLSLVSPLKHALTRAPSQRHNDPCRTPIE